MGEPTDPKHRGPALRIASSQDDDPQLKDVLGKDRGALLAYVMNDKTDGADTTRMVGFRVFLPQSVINADRPYLRFRAKPVSK